MNILVMAVMSFLLAACASQLPETACGDHGAARLAAGVDAYNHSNIALAFMNLRAAADCGNSDAQVNLGYMYARGQGVSADQTEALRLYQLSAAQGNGEGMNAVAYKYQYGTGVAVDISQAVQWYCKAVERGNARAMNNLALLYLRGSGVPRSIEVARDLWKQSAERGHANAMFNLGMSYLEGPGERDTEQGTKLVIEAALHGHEQAQQRLRNSGYKGELPPPLDEAAIMTIQPSQLSPGHAPACGKPTTQS